MNEREAVAIIEEMGDCVADQETIDSASMVEPEHERADCAVVIDGSTYDIYTDWADLRLECEGYIAESLWAFQPAFLASHTNLDVCVFEALSELSETANDAVRAIIDSLGDFDTFVDEAIGADGEGHFLPFAYDGVAHEVTVDGNDYWVVRTN